ncbi:transmembrane protein 241 [Gracilinanus agilis]|uniref:transmembrane protein 241 n=1 Tax=Gracilinanus agilis TaxID=191870 RepID=UPI001CFDC759|nr:transmembrane protein 241 [Gracilinanus agilis]
MQTKRPFPGLTFCAFYLATYLTNKYVLSVLKFTYPTLFQGWQTLIGGLLLHISWKLGWVEINSNCRAKVLAWLPSSMLFVGIIYAGSRALSRLLPREDSERLSGWVTLSGDLFRALEFPFLYFYRFHTSCCASGFLGFFLMLSSVKLKNNVAPGQHTAWIFFAKGLNQMMHKVPSSSKSSTKRKYHVT